MSVAGGTEQDEGENEAGNSPAFNRTQRLLLLALFAILLVLRLRSPWEHGRFQEEEATVFVAYAWHFPWLPALFRSFGGYWNIGANASTVLLVQLVKGGIIPLERAPYFTMTVALAVQLLPALLILNGRASWLRSRLAIVAALLLIATAPATEEVFFNVMHIQFQLALCVGLILALDVPDGRAARLGYGALLFTAPLCGPAAIVLVPLFALRAWADRSRGRFSQLGWLGAGAAVQMLIFYAPVVARGQLADPVTVAAAMFLRQIVLPAGGIDVAEHVGSAMYFSQAGGGWAWWCIAGFGLILFITLLVVAIRRRDAAVWLALSALSISAASLGFGMLVARQVSYFRVTDGERYNFLPNILLGLAVIVLATRPATRARPIYLALCLLIVTTGVIYLPRTLSVYSQGPSWPAEVAKWRKDHNHPLAVWLGKDGADLSDVTRPCSPIGPDPEKSTAPHYCESGWLAAFYRSQ